ncbi:MAG: DMT family transporter [Maritimibacter harenae]|jgi:transporter family-2 protein|uniref:EamA-like transporter family protein n=1 Tax=Maritimibacter harenae TaxID=2606218 RepID=A0A845M325_9RHOB|nr:DMT family transporter [Maritimibacter harenae]MZR14445.1 EamA-like transporter family protein [Maritimibacter harenae]
MSGTPAYAATMLLAGFGIPVFAALSSALGQKIGNPFATGVVTFGVALTIGIVAALVTGPGALARIGEAPRHLLLGGFLVAFYVLSITFVAPRFGVGNAVFFVLLGQLLSAAAIDHYGLFGARVSPVSLTRAAGIAVMAIGVWLTQKT